MYENAGGHGPPAADTHGHVWPLGCLYTHVIDEPKNGTSLFMLLLYFYSSCNQLTITCSISKATPFMDVK